MKSKKIIISKLEDLPTLGEIRSIPRGLELKIIFNNQFEKQRNKIGANWKKHLPGFLVAMHMNGSEVNILKLITDEEVYQHQLLFEKCAKEFGKLANKLMAQFIKEFEVEDYNGFPLNTLNPSGNGNYNQSGRIGEWIFRFHGFHCRFTNKLTTQSIEVPLTFGEEFGVLDPYFFPKFIKSTASFQPFPVKFYNDFWDGKRILDIMVSYGKFEEINSNIHGLTGIVVSDRAREKINIIDNNVIKSNAKNRFVWRKMNWWVRLMKKLKI